MRTYLPERDQQSVQAGMANLTQASRFLPGLIRNVRFLFRNDYSQATALARFTNAPPSFPARHEICQRHPHPTARLRKPTKHVIVILHQ
jgi:hypothetical protein